MKYLYLILSFCLVSFTACTEKQTSRNAMAYYALANHYNEIHHAPLALINYQKSLDLLLSDNDNALIADIYYRMAQIDMYSYLYEPAISLLEKSLTYYRLVGNDIQIATVFKDMAQCYAHIYQYEKAYSCCLKAYKISMCCKEKSSLGYVSELISLNLDMGNAYKADSLLSAYRSDFVQDSTRHDFYYLSLGSVYAAKQQVDSALFYLNKASNSTSLSYKEKSYFMLCYLYQRLGKISLALKCSEKCRELMEQNENLTHSKEIAQLQTFYNYNKFELKSRILSESNLHKQHIITLLVIVLLLVGLIVFYYHQRTIKQRLQQEKTIMALDLQNKRDKEFISNQSKLIESNKNELDKWHYMALQRDTRQALSIIKDDDEIWDGFRQMDVFNFFHSIVSGGELISTHTEVVKQLKLLRETIDILFDNYGARLRLFYPSINETQLNICYLIKAEVRLINISIILSIAKQTVTSARTRMSKCCFDKVQTNKTFDDFIHDF